MHIQRSTYTLITQYTQISVNYNIIYFGYYSLLTMNVLKFNLSHPFYHRQGYINAYIRRVIPNLAYKTTGLIVFGLCCVRTQSEHVRSLLIYAPLGFTSS